MKIEKRREKRVLREIRGRGGRWEKKREADDISCVTKVRVEDKNLDAGDEVCVFYEIRFLNFARWFPRSGSRKDNNGAFATFFPRAKFPSHWWTLVPCTFSETLSVGRVNRAPLAPFAKRDEKKEEEKGRRETSSFVKPETRATIFLHFPRFSTKSWRTGPKKGIGMIENNCRVDYIRVISMDVDENLSSVYFFFPLFLFISYSNNWCWLKKTRLINRVER